MGDNIVTTNLQTYTSVEEMMYRDDNLRPYLLSNHPNYKSMKKMLDGDWDSITRDDLKALINRDVFVAYRCINDKIVFNENIPAVFWMIYNYIQITFNTDRSLKIEMNFSHFKVTETYRGKTVNIISRNI